MDIDLRQDDPYLAFRFAVELDQCVVAGFSEVSGIALEIQVETFREGGQNLYEQQLAGPNKYPSRLILKRGMTAQDSLWSWYQEVLGGRILRKELSIVLWDSAGEVKKRWKFYGACPVKFSGPQFQAGTAAVAFETIELVHNGPLPS